jgi:hypothetical protein
VEDFLDFHHVSQRKLLFRMNETMGPGTLSKEMADKVEAQFQEVREKFGFTEVAQSHANQTKMLPLTCIHSVPSQVL